MQADVFKYSAEVRHLSSPRELEGALNEHGRQGWKLQGHEVVGRTHTFYFIKTNDQYEYHVCPTTVTELQRLIDFLNLQTEEAWNLCLVLSESSRGPGKWFIFLRDY